MGAIAGKVMMRPRGDYDPSAIYDKLDLVKYDNKPWLCLRNNVMGVTPSSDDKVNWMNIIDISVSNADTLDGFHADYFATAVALADAVNIINGLTAEDVGARPEDWMPTASDVGARPEDWMPTASDVGARPADWTPTPGEIGAAPSSHTHAGKDVTGLTVSRALTSSSTGAVTVSSVTSTELGYLSGVTSAVQTQINGKAASSHNHAASEITSGTLGVARGGTGATTFTSGEALIGAGTGAVTTRTIKHSTTSAVAGTGNNLATCGTVTYHVNNKLNRLDAVTAANTSYATYMARGIALVEAVPTSMTNGCVAFVYA